MEATANIQGTIRLRSQIKMRKRKNEPAHYRKIRFQSKWDRKFMCIFKNRKWIWEPLSQLSATNYTKYHKQFHDPKNCAPLEPNETPIAIECNNCNFESNRNKINGIYTPIHEEKHDNDLQVYKKEGDNDLWLYQVLFDNNTKMQWWIGDSINCLRRRRKAHGYAHTKKLTHSFATSPPAYPQNITGGSARHWWIYDGPDLQNLAWKAASTNQNDIFAKSAARLSNNEKNMENTICDQSNELKVLKSHNSHLTALIKTYYNSITPELREKIFETDLKDMFKKSNICSLCFSCKPITKCIHIDCVGCCKECRDAAASGGGGDGTCCACKKTQVLQCPICLDEHTEQYLKILNCSHCVCWKCFCKSYEVQRPIEKCPTCRSALNSSA